MPDTLITVDVTNNNNTPIDPRYQYIDAIIKTPKEDDANFQELYGRQLLYDSYEDLLSDL